METWKSATCSLQIKCGSLTISGSCILCPFKFTFLQIKYENLERRKVNAAMNYKLL